MLLVYNENIQKAYTERQRILLNQPGLPLQTPHITLLDIHFNAKHKFYNDIVKPDFLKLIIESSYYQHLHDITIKHTQNNYDIMGPFWGKKYSMDDHTRMINFREAIYKNLPANSLHPGDDYGVIFKREQIESNGIRYTYYRVKGVPGELFCVPEYHTVNNWTGHISVTKFEVNPNITKPYFHEMALNIHNNPFYTIQNIEMDGMYFSIRDLFHMYSTNKKQKLNTEVSERIQKFISENMEQYLPIIYKGITELNIKSNPRMGILPWENITFNKSNKIQVNLQGPSFAKETFDIIISLDQSHDEG